MRRFRKPIYQQWYRGFESPPFRQSPSPARIRPGMFFLSEGLAGDGDWRKKGAAPPALVSSLLFVGGAAAGGAPNERACGAAPVAMGDGVGGAAAECVCGAAAARWGGVGGNR